MNLHVEEPLDHLVACVHHLLTLQPQGSPGDDSATAANTFGFTLSEEQDVCAHTDEIFDAGFDCVLDEFVM